MTPLLNHTIIPNVKSLGILLYGIMLVVVGVVALYSIVLLLRMCDITGHRSYEEIAFAAFGKRGMTFVILCITLHTFGCLVGFLMVVKYELPSGGFFSFSTYTYKFHFSRESTYRNRSMRLVLVYIARSPRCHRCDNNRRPACFC